MGRYMEKVDDITNALPPFKSETIVHCARITAQDKKTPRTLVEEGGGEKKEKACQ